jgi:transcription antitermination factor NusA-like protein
MKKVMTVAEVKALESKVNDDARFSLREDRDNHCVIARPKGTTLQQVETEFKGKKIIVVQETRQDKDGKDFQGWYLLKLFTAEAIVAEVERDFDHTVAMAKAKEIAAAGVSFAQINAASSLLERTV